MSEAPPQKTSSSHLAAVDTTVLPPPPLPTPQVLLLPPTRSKKKHKTRSFSLCVLATSRLLLFPLISNQMHFHFILPPPLKKRKAPSLTAVSLP